MTSSTTSKCHSSNQESATGSEYQLYQPIKSSGNILTPQEIEKKLKLSIGLFEAAFEIKKHQLRQKHPEKNEIELNHMTMSLIEKGTR